MSKNEFLKLRVTPAGDIVVELVRLRAPEPGREIIGRTIRRGAWIAVLELPELHFISYVESEIDLMRFAMTDARSGRNVFPYTYQEFST